MQSDSTASKDVAQFVGRITGDNAPIIAAVVNRETPVVYRESPVYSEQYEAERIKLEERTALDVISPYACEFFGTFLLTLTVGYCSHSGNSTLNPTAIGSVLMVLIYSVGPVSGGNLNPAVSLTLALLGKLRWPVMFGYWIAQICGGLLAGFTVFALFQEGINVGPHGEYDMGSAAMCEILYTAMLCFVVANCAASTRNNPKGDNNQFYALAIGFVIIAGGHACGSISGAFFNPAVSIGFGVFTGLLYVLFHAIGVAVAVICFKAVRPEEKSVEGDVMIMYEYFDPPLQTKCLSEYIGTHMLVTTVGLNILTGSDATGWSAGACLMSMIYSLGDVSGAHFNPAVSIAVWLSGRSILQGSFCILYIAMQVLASIIAGFALSFIHVRGGFKDVSFGVGPQEDATWGQAMVVEIMFTFILCFVVLSCATVSLAFPGNPAPPRKNFYFAFAIGACVTLAGVAIGHVSGACINPAVAMGLSVEMSSVVDNMKTSPCTTTPEPIYWGTVIEKPQAEFDNFAWYSWFEICGGAIAALVFHSTHSHEYYPKNMLC